MFKKVEENETLFSIIIVVVVVVAIMIIIIVSNHFDTKRYDTNYILAF